jgi:hypothetical protein
MRKPFLILICLLGAAIAPALAGPPLICHPIDIGNARSLPWNTQNPGWNGMLPDYNVSHLVQDTLTLLQPDTPVQVRMETLRRAAIYSSRNPALANALLARLMQRTRQAQTPALFDAGYFAEAVNEAARVRIALP